MLDACRRDRPCKFRTLGVREQPRPKGCFDGGWSYVISRRGTQAQADKPGQSQSAGSQAGQQSDASARWAVRVSLKPPSGFSYTAIFRLSRDPELDVNANLVDSKLLPSSTTRGEFTIGGFGAQPEAPPKPIDPPSRGSRCFALNVPSTSEFPGQPGAGCRASARPTLA